MQQQMQVLQVWAPVHSTLQLHMWPVVTEMYGRIKNEFVICSQINIYINQ